MVLLYVALGWGILITLGWIIDRVTTLREHKASKLASRAAELDAKAATVERTAALAAKARVDVEMISKEKALGFPWVATVYSEYFRFLDERMAEALEVKKHAAPKAGEALRVSAKEKAALRKENKILRELYRYYETLFPWLIDFQGEDLDDIIRDATSIRTAADDEEVSTPSDPAYRWLTSAEVNSAALTRTQKYQRALDRYWNRRKTPWQIGRDYERYIGFLYEQKGYKVEYYGIAYGYEDLGRDLIRRKDSDVRIVQCKYWRAERPIHEKYVCQLLGTTLAYHKQQQAGRDLLQSVGPASWLYTSSSLSETAKQFAMMLEVHIVQNFPLGKYPVIKCNVSRRNGEKIYHLPFDQQYDRTLIAFESEHYVNTVAEAEALGFRRAYRWRGSAASAAS